MMTVFGLLSIMALSGSSCDNERPSPPVANPAFNGTFNGNITTTRGGESVSETATVVIKGVDELRADFDGPDEPRADFDGSLRVADLTFDISGSASDKEATFSATDIDLDEF